MRLRSAELVQIKSPGISAMVRQLLLQTAVGIPLVSKLDGTHGWLSGAPRNIHVYIPDDEGILLGLPFGRDGQIWPMLVPSGIYGQVVGQEVGFGELWAY